MIKSGITEMVSPAVMVIEPYTYYRFLSGTSCLLIVTFWGHHGDQEGPNEVTVNEEHLMKLIIPPSPPTVDKQSDA
jgi:hypothetical protein